MFDVEGMSSEVRMRPVEGSITLAEVRASKRSPLGGYAADTPAVGSTAPVQSAKSEK